MPVEFFALFLRLPVFVLVIGRLGGLIMFQPMIGGLIVPVRVRMMLMFGLAVLITPLVDLNAAAPDTFGGITLAMAGEVLLGALMGLMVRVVFLGLEMGGLLIAQESGLAFGQIADPTTGIQQSMVGNFYVQLASVIFLILGGHRALFAVALDTFRTVPLLGGGTVFIPGIEVLFDAMMVGAIIAVRVAAPVVLTLFLISVALGFISRTVPQLNIITIGFPIKGLIGFTMIAITLPPAMEAFLFGLEEVVAWIGEMAVLTD